jgi:hypothetical protein
VEAPGKVANVREVVMNGPALDECTLAMGNNPVYKRLQSKGQQFSHYLCYGMDEANGTEVVDRVTPSFLGMSIRLAVFRMLKNYNFGCGRSE